MNSTKIEMVASLDDNKVYIFTNRIEVNTKLQILKENRAMYFTIPENQNLSRMEIKITITDYNGFFKSIDADINHAFTDVTFNIEPVISRNRISLKYIEPRRKQNLIRLSKHFNLAFQGGGAKGLAYVGAYKAIAEYRTNSDSPVPISSIMGSSAGGIIALAISTGIPDYELQKVCYKMRQIPVNDRFDGDDNMSESMDNQLKYIRTLLDEYGILQGEAFDKIRGYLQSKHVEVIEEKLVRFLEAASPTFG